MRVCHRVSPVAAVVMLLGASSGFAQSTESEERSAADEADRGALQEVLVTARKREESLLEAPVAVSALTAADIEAAGIRSLEDIARSAPGIQYNDQGGQFPGRFDSAIRFRGMNVNSSGHTYQLGALFLDGIYVLGGTHSIPVDNLERVEVVRGPQAAYYGRNTFGGAVNYITRAPSLTEHSASLDLLGAEFNESEISAAYEGPIVADRLAFRLSVRQYSRGGVWTASDGGQLGEQSTKSASLTLRAQPTDALGITLRGFIARDDDGPAAGALIAGQQNDSCTGKTIITKAGESASPRNYVCGKVPGPDSAVPVQGVGNIIDANTSLFPQRAQVVGKPNAVRDLLYAPRAAGLSVPDIDGFGLKRDISRFSAALDYEFENAMSLVVQGGINDSRRNSLRDYGPAAFENWYSREMVQQEDSSAEIRLTSAPASRLEWSVGANYYEQKYRAPNNAGDVLSLCIDTFNSNLVPADGQCLPTGTLLLPEMNLGASDAVETLGFFGSVSYDVLESVTINLEGRYQTDKNKRGSPNPIEVDYETFLPRAILQWRPGDSTNFYASYAKGTLPGALNTAIINATPYELEQFRTLVPTSSAFTEEEELDSYEIGWKQSLMNGTAFFAATAYYGKWKNQKGRIATLINQTCTAGRMGTTGCRPALGEAELGEPSRLADGTPYYFSSNIVVPGTADLYGLELEGAASIGDSWKLTGALTYADSEYTDFIFNFVEPIAGFSDMKGNMNARFPKWSGYMALSNEIPLTDNWKLLSRLDVSYFGKTYADESNLAYCEAYAVANARVGAENGAVRVELFARNLFDDDSWTACSRWTDFENPTVLPGITFSQGIAATPQMPRQFGLRASIRF